MITGATDGIGLATAKLLAASGHNLLLHGRSEEKLHQVKEQLCTLVAQQSHCGAVGRIQTYLADLSNLSAVKGLANEAKSAHESIDVLINNAGIFKVAQPITPDGFDARFMVNTVAPYLLTQQLLPLLNTTQHRTARVINLSSAAQAPVNIDALLGKQALADMDAYAQSKLAITMWTKGLAEQYKHEGPVFLSVNPGSLLASKMVKQGFGLAGNDINIGAKILVRMAIEQGLEKYSGQYFDNDSGDFSAPHPDGESLQKAQAIIKAIEQIISLSKGS